MKYFSQKLISVKLIIIKKYKLFIKILFTKFFSVQKNAINILLELDPFSTKNKMISKILNF